MAAKSRKKHQVFYATVPKGKRIVYDRKEVLLKSNTVPTGAFIIISGIVKYSIVQKKKHITVNFYGPGSIHGLSCLFDIHNPFDLISLSKCEVEFIPREILESNYTHKSNRKIVTELLNDQYSVFYSRLIATITENISDNIIRGLQELAQLNWDSHIDTIPKKELALYAGCSVEYVFRTLSKLEKKGVISIKGGRITIKKEELID